MSIMRRMPEEARPPAADRQLEDAARSTYNFVSRRAERVTGGVRWQTLDWENQPQYDLSVFYGSAGIPIFLAEHFRVTQQTAALDLAIAGARWCSQPERLTEGSAEEWRNDGLVRGRAGVGYAWLRIAQAAGGRSGTTSSSGSSGSSGTAGSTGTTGTPAVAHTGGLPEALGQARAIADDLLSKDLGGYPEWLDGACGKGIFLLRLAEATGDQRYLDGALRIARWLEQIAIRDEHGLYWPWSVGTGDDPWYGLSFIPGAAGIAHFLLSLHQATRDARWADLARDGGETLRRQAVGDRGGKNWPDTLDGLQRGERLKAQWCYGAPGVGLYFAKAYQVFGDEADLALAEAAGECVYQYGDVRRNPCQCHGLAGNGELLLDLYLATGKPVWRERAREFATMALAYRRSTPDGDEWQSDDTGYYSPEYMLGASGTGAFFLRLLHPDTITRALV